MRCFCAVKSFLRPAGQSVQGHIQHPAVLAGVSAEDSLQLKARLLQHPAGANIVGKRLRIDAQDIRLRKYSFAELSDSLRHDTTAPILPGQIVPQLCRAEMDITLAKGTDAAYRPSSRQIA